MAVGGMWMGSAQRRATAAGDLVGEWTSDSGGRIA